MMGQIFERVHLTVWNLGHQANSCGVCKLKFYSFKFNRYHNEYSAINRKKANIGISKLIIGKNIL